jgi:hypothetical protein
MVEHTQRTTHAKATDLARASLSITRLVAP